MKFTVADLISNLEQYDPELEVKFTDNMVFYNSKDRGSFVGIEIGEEEKSPAEASNIFHSIMKASVTPKKAEKDKKEIKPKEDKK